MEYNDEFVTVGDTSIRLLSKGNGEPILFLHGAGGGGKWLPFMESLSAKYKVLSPEHPGFGKSDDPAWLEDISDLVLFYTDFLDTLGLGKVHLIGLSLGGWLAAEIAVAYRERLLSLTLVDAAGIYVPNVPTGDNFMWNKETSIYNTYNNKELAEQILSYEPTSEDNEIWLKNRETSAKLAWNPRWHNPKLSKRLGRINLPTLIVWGENDLLFPVEYGVEYQKLIPDSKLVVIKECGHLPNVEQAEEFTNNIFNFLGGE
ncbi:alpha/beta hydrolase [Bacillus sp. M6-12]|uniref:alpha/beta fold hydrolase n=1 Tax=Bacillus sp. M6-12 TaxID=2054166 RepID=UPI000C767300|nr:alpha/beta hydrolase [Bacillus sp. M6-12]PLS18552.1 alpha/beta hydrolase [Bacillus sp. M6-12]